jgi:SAM-dependent methyltransferase
VAFPRAVQQAPARGSFLPRLFGQDFFLAGYRVFVKFRTAGARTLRGLYILRSDADRALMVAGGNLHAAEPVDCRRLPLADASVDAALLLLSAHELRRRPSRVALLRELRRALAPTGKVVLAEHLRDARNFLAFGPGCLHFWSAREWRANATAAGLAVERELQLTPWVTVFLRRPSC